MSKMLKSYGGLMLFYGVIILGFVLLNERFRYLNQLELSCESSAREGIQKN
ncbi:MAG: hypothetical protein HFH86_04930 [Bacilli bacterium]|jgi:hypothetical protein|nr:hypothetical protein [Bacilli bacterium]